MRSGRVDASRAALLPDTVVFLKPWVRAPTMVGRVRSSVMRPAAATAPAPMGRT